MLNINLLKKMFFEGTLNDSLAKNSTGYILSLQIKTEKRHDITLNPLQLQQGTLTVKNRCFLGVCFLPGFGRQHARSTMKAQHDEIVIWTAWISRQQTLWTGWIATQHFVFGGLGGASVGRSKGFQHTTEWKCHRDRSRSNQTEGTLLQLALNRNTSFCPIKLQVKRKTDDALFSTVLIKYDKQKLRDITLDDTPTLTTPCPKSSRPIAWQLSGEK